MKKIYAVFTLVLFVCSTTAQVNTTIIHQKVFGGSESDNINKILKTADGYLLAGNSNSGISGDKTETCRGGSDMWIIKTDNDFNIQWQRTIGGSQDDFFNAVEMTPDSGYMLVATTKSPVSGEKTVTNYGYNDFWVVRIDKAGNILWQFTYGGVAGSTNILSGICKGKNSEYILYGSSDSNAGGLKTEISRGYIDIWIVCIDSSGNYLWDKTIGGNYMEDPEYCFFNSNENAIIMAGMTNSDSSGDITIPNFGIYSDLMLFKLEENDGNIISQVRLGGNDVDDNTTCIYVNEKPYLIAYSYSDSSGTKTENNRGIDSLTCDYWITKLSDTIIVWDKTIGGNKDDVPKGAFLTEDNNQIIIYGLSESTISGEKTESCRGMWDYWLVAIDTNANILWQKTFGGSNYDLPMDMLMLGHNHYVVAGSSQSPISGDKTENTRGGRDFWILEISTTMNIEDFSPQRLHVFPNPIADFVKVELPENSTSGQLYVFDITGAIVHSEIINAESNQVNLSNLASGVYFISYFDESGTGWSAEVQKL